MNEVEKNLGKLSVVRWKKHTLLGINIEIKDNTIKVDMVEQLEDCIEMFGGDVSTSVTSQTNKILSEVREYAKQLSDNKG